MVANCIKYIYIVNKHSLELFVLMETMLCALSLPDTGETITLDPSTTTQYDFSIGLWIIGENKLCDQQVYYSYIVLWKWKKIWSTQLQSFISLLYDFKYGT